MERISSAPFLSILTISGHIRLPSWMSSSHVETTSASSSFRGYAFAPSYWAGASTRSLYFADTVSCFLFASWNLSESIESRPNLIASSFRSFACSNRLCSSDFSTEGFSTSASGWTWGCCGSLSGELAYLLSGRHCRWGNYLLCPHGNTSNFL